MILIWCSTTRLLLLLLKNTSSIHSCDKKIISILKIWDLNRKFPDGKYGSTSKSVPKNIKILRSLQTFDCITLKLGNKFSRIFPFLASLIVKLLFQLAVHRRQKGNFYIQSSQMQLHCNVFLSRLNAVRRCFA